jgi:hypothetical protein
MAVSESARVFYFMGKIMKARGLQANFVQIPNTIVQSKLLSLKAKGLLCYLLSLPEDWVVYKTKLHTELKEGRDATIEAFNELIEHGYILQVQIIGEGGRFEYDYVVYNEAVKPVSGKAVNGNTVTDNPCTVKPLPYKEDNNKEIITKKENKESKPSQFQPIGYKREWEIPFMPEFKAKVTNQQNGQTALNEISELWETWIKVRYITHNRKFNTDISEAQALKTFLDKCKNAKHAIESLKKMIASESANPFVVDEKEMKKDTIIRDHLGRDVSRMG